MTLVWTQRPIGKVDFEANKTKTLEVPRDSIFRRMVLRFKINLTTTATAPTYLEDDILRLIKKITLKSNGKNIKFDNSARMWFYLEKIEKGTTPHKIDPPTAVSTTADAIVVLIADFAINRTDENSVDALLPARRFSSLILSIEWGTNTDIASANAPTINVADTRCDVEVTEVTGTTTIRKPDGTEAVTAIEDVDFIDLIEAIETITIDAVHSQFDNNTLTKNVAPAPATIFATAWMVLDDGVKSNALVTDWKVQKEKGNKVLIKQRTFNSLREELKTEYAQESLTTGFIYQDWLDLLDGGLDNLGNEGDVRFRWLTIAPSGTDTIELFTRSVSAKTV